MRMTWRERLADWISGGAVTRAKKNKFDDVQLIVGSLVVQRNKCKSTLERIAAMETPGANATVKRMARLAREALE